MLTHTHTSKSHDAGGQLFKRCPQRARPNLHHPPHQHHLALSQPIRMAINHASHKPLQLVLHLSPLLSGSLSLFTSLDSPGIPWNQEMSFPHLSLLTFLSLPPLMAPDPPRSDENVSSASSCSRELL